MRYMKNAYNIVETGKRKVSLPVYLHRYYVDEIRQWPGRIFKIPSPMGWQVVITDPAHIEDIRKAPEHILSARKAVQEVC